MLYKRGHGNTFTGEQPSTPELDLDLDLDPDPDPDLDLDLDLDLDPDLDLPHEAQATFLLLYGFRLAL